MGEVFDDTHNVAPCTVNKLVDDGRGVLFGV